MASVLQRKAVPREGWVRLLGEVALRVEDVGAERPRVSLAQPSSFSIQIPRSCNNCAHFQLRSAPVVGAPERYRASRAASQLHDDDGRFGVLKQCKDLQRGYLMMLKSTGCSAGPLATACSPRGSSCSSDCCMSARSARASGDPWRRCEAVVFCDGAQGKSMG